MEDKSQVEVAVRRIETTVGELVEAITQMAMEAGKSEEEGYELASLTLQEIMRKHCKGLNILVN